MSKLPEMPTPQQCFEMGRLCACYNLRRAARAVTQLFDVYFDRIGLKATQYTVLAVLAHRQAQARPSTVTELATGLVLEQSSLSRNLAVLERLGYVRLVPGSDRRQRVVTLTRAGRRVVARGYPLWQQAQAAIADAAGGELEGQLETLRRMTRKAQSLRPPKARTKAASVERMRA